LDEKGIAKNAREEKLKERAKAKDQDPRYHDEMARLYRQHVLKESATPVIQIQGLKGGKKEQPVA
jgi:hypothetical protein